MDTGGLPGDGPEKVASTGCLKGIFMFDGLVIPKGGYKTLVVDPPWPIKKIQRRVRPNQKNMDYPLMSLEEIKKLNIGDIAHAKSHLFLWTIDKFLYLSKDILEGWGFKYHCTIAWNKTNGISLYGFNRRVEFILVGFKGTHEAYPKRKTIPTAFTAKSKRHSEKPDMFYNFLDILPDPKVDLFARKKREGWDVWGNEV